MSGAFKLDSPLYSGFVGALQRVLEKHLPNDHTKAATIWMDIQDLPEFAAIVRDEAKRPAPSPERKDV